MRHLGEWALLWLAFIPPAILSPLYWRNPYWRNPARAGRPRRGERHIIINITAPMSGFPRKSQLFLGRDSTVRLPRSLPPERWRRHPAVLATRPDPVRRLIQPTCC